MARFNPKVGDLVYIRWDDHCSYHGSAWRPIKEIADAMTGSECETVGFVLHISPECITMAANVTINDDEPDCSQVATRLRRAIVRGKIIKRFK
jgi:hypothetical protein